MENIDKLYSAICELEQIKRTGWVMRKVEAERLESVSDHTLQVLVLAVTFVHELNLDFDIAKLVQMCFIHDIGESIVGDVSDIDKNFEDRKKLEREKTIEFLSSLPKSLSVYLDLWIEAEDKKTEMAKFLYEVDKLDAIIKAKKYSIDNCRPDIFEEFYNNQLQKGTYNNSYLSKYFEELR